MNSLGSLEETILLLVLAMEEDAYGFSVSEAYRAHMGKSISISAVHTVLARLEKKGLISSQLGGATSERGGRRKRIFTVTGAGEQVRHLQQHRHHNLDTYMYCHYLPHCFHHHHHHRRSPQRTIVSAYRPGKYCTDPPTLDI